MISKTRSASFFFSVVMFLKLLCPSDLLLNFLKAFVEENKEVRVDADPTFRLAGPPVLKHEAHPLLLQLIGGDGVPGELNDLVLHRTVLPTGLQPKRLEGHNGHNVSVLLGVGGAVGKHYPTIPQHLPVR